MEEKRLLSKDEVYFLVFFSNFFIGSIILSGRYHFDPIRSFFIFAGEDPFPFTLFFIVFFCCLYYMRSGLECQYFFLIFLEILLTR